MRKFLIALALVASPVVAEPVMPGPDASFEERLEYIRQLNAEAAEKHKQAVAESEQRLRDFNIKVGLPADYKTYGTGRGCRYSCVTTVTIGSKMYRVRVSRY
jgi:restriction endonuclease S subunit